MKKVVLMLLLVLSAITLTGCDLFKPAEKEFSGSGITITLNEDFSVTETVLVPFYLVSLDDIFMGSRESKSLFKNTTINSLQDYAEASLANAGHEDATIYESDSDTDYIYAYYSATNDGTEFGYMLICMESDDYYYVMNLGCLNKDLEGNKEQYIEWANTISVD